MYDHDLWPQYQKLYIHREFVSGQDRLRFDIGKFGTWVRQHGVTFV